MGINGLAWGWTVHAHTGLINGPPSTPQLTKHQANKPGRQSHTTMAQTIGLSVSASTHLEL